MKVGFISLGCSKNLVDTEMCIGLFKKNNFTIVNQPQEVDIIVVNTCGFIESAKQEAINTILEMAEYKNANCKYLIVMGCLVQRYKNELQKELPEVDLFLSIDEYENIWDKIQELIKTNENNCKNLEYLDRVLTTGNTTAYLKIAEGCSNYCTYCAIPYIRGAYCSRKFEDIIEEAKELASIGIKELIIIAQDTTKYGIDIYGKPRLHELLNEVCKIDGIKWVRFLYAYPESITDELIETVKKNEKICNYFDIPIQHISDSILKKMNRKTSSKNIKKIIEKIRTNIPDAILRTSLIVGFPGETKEDFEQLYEFVQQVKFDKLGVFMYSKEDGTPAEKLPDQVYTNTKKARHKKTMTIQQEISKNNLEEKIGKKYLALIEGITKDGKFYIGRTYADVPDMDGVVFIKSKKQLNLGQFVECRITNVAEYDLIGEIE